MASDDSGGEGECGVAMGTHSTVVDNVPEK